MEKYNCYTLVFSSSCTVYGEPESLPITEEKETGRRVTNVYGKTKYFIEEMLKDVSHSNEVSNKSIYSNFHSIKKRKIQHRNGILSRWDISIQWVHIHPAWWVRIQQNNSQI